MMFAVEPSLFCSHGNELIGAVEKDLDRQILFLYSRDQEVRWDYFRMACVICSVTKRTLLPLINRHDSNLNLRATINLISFGSIIKL